MKPYNNLIVCAPPPPPPPVKNFSKMAIMGGDGKFLLEMGGKARNGGDGKLLKSFDIVDRGVPTPLFYKDPTILPIPPFSNVVHSTPTSLSHPTPTSTVLSVVMFL